MNDGEQGLVTEILLAAVLVLMVAMVTWMMQPRSWF